MSEETSVPERKADLYDSYVLFVENRYPLCVELNGKPHVLLFLSAEEAVESGKVKNKTGEAFRCNSGKGNWIFHRSLRLGNKFAFCMDGRVHPVTGFAKGGGS